MMRVYKKLDNVITIANALQLGVSELKGRVRKTGFNNINLTFNPRLDADVLLEYVLNVDRTYVLTHNEKQISNPDFERYMALVRRRKDGEPLQYLTGRQEFWGLEFKVTPDVLIPRPETELIIELALNILRPHFERPFICDIGTGSGCIAIALLYEMAGATAVGVDISEKALSVAVTNARRHGVADRFTVLPSDIYNSFSIDETGGIDNPFTIVVSNPPYIPEDEIPTLQTEVRDHEPFVALTSGGDGLSIIRRLLKESPRYLMSNGYLIFEIGFDQSETVHHLIDQNVWKVVDLALDLQAIPRVFVLQLN
ncbi:MAG: peptide chain release factor N(5)-glutamine methyltransferase [Pyrinomonadaceae bacterium]